MRGRVFAVNETKGMVAVLTEDGNFSIFELLGSDTVEKGHEVYWEDDTALGDELLTNITENESFEVYFQNHHVSKDQLKNQLLY